MRDAPEHASQRLSARLARIGIGVKALAGPVTHAGSQLHSVAGWIGTGVSGTFLYVIAAVNIGILWGIIKCFARCGGATTTKHSSSISSTPEG